MVTVSPLIRPVIEYFPKEPQDAGRRFEGDAELPGGGFPCLVGHRAPRRRRRDGCAGDAEEDEREALASRKRIPEPSPGPHTRIPGYACWARRHGTWVHSLGTFGPCERIHKVCILHDMSNVY